MASPGPQLGGRLPEAGCLAEPPISMTAAASSSRTSGAYRVDFPQTGQMSPEAASQRDSSRRTANLRIRWESPGTKECSRI